MSNMKETVNNSGGGLGFLSILTLIFITLKLCNIITWSWWWVLAPTWIPIAIVLAIFGTLIIVAITLATLAGFLSLFGGK